MAAAYSVYLGTTFATYPTGRLTGFASSGSPAPTAASTASSAAAAPSSTSGAEMLGPSSWLVAGLVGLAIMGYAAV
jgi:hypothetical protein